MHINTIKESWINGTILYPDNYAVTPAIDLSTASETVVLEWYVADQDQAWPSDYYDVKISTTGPLVGNFTTTLYSEAVQAGGPEPGQYWKRIVDVSAYAGQTIYIAFVHTNCHDKFMLNIDDVSVYGN